MCTFWSDAKVHVIIPPKSTKSGVIMKLLQGWLLYWHLFFKEQKTEKGSARHILCLCGVIYEAWNWIPWSSRHSTVTTWQSESEGWQSGSQYRHMHADRKIYAQTEIHSEQNPLSYRPIRSTEKSFPVIIHQAEQLELFQIPDSFSGAPISVAKHHASEGGTQA